MSFDEASTPRATDGKFAEKTGAKPEVTLDASAPLEASDRDFDLKTIERFLPEGIAWHGKDSTTPEGFSVAFGKADDSSIYSYLLDDETGGIVGRIESSKRPIGNGYDTRVYQGSGLRGGYYVSAGSAEGHEGMFKDIVAEYNRGKTVDRVEDELNAKSDLRIAEYARRKRDEDSTLEHILRNENGIPIVLRQKLIRAYESDNGRVELPALLHEGASYMKDDLLRDLRRLAEDAAS